MLVSGFGAFETVRRNPSGELARALEEEPPPGVAVRGGELPVSFRRSPQAFDALVASLAPDQPRALLALGVQSTGSTFRLERRARWLALPGRPDNDGEEGPAVVAGGAEAPRETAFDLDRLAGVLDRAGAHEVEVSGDAGGYVCERVYHHVLTTAERLGVPGLFLHVPPIQVMDTRRQLPVVRALVAAMVARSPA